VALTVGRPRLWALALVAFLTRGGLVALALPIVVLPTFIGLSNLVGPASVSAAGPGERLVALMALAVSASLGLAIAGTIVAAAAEAALHLQAVEPARRDRAPGQGADEAWWPPAPLAVTGLRRGTVRIAAIRLALIVPVVAAIAIAVPSWVTASYRELTLPSDVAAPLALRILAGAPLATVLVLVAWLGGEVVGGFAARRAVLLDAPVPRALAAALGDPFRSPGGTLVTVIGAVLASVAVLAPAAWGVDAAWGLARRALVDGLGPIPVLGATLLLVAAWGVALVLAGVSAAWRANLVTAELLRRRPGLSGPSRPPGPDGTPAPRHAGAGPRVG
jgi:hypothetical protein